MNNTSAPSGTRVPAIIRSIWRYNSGLAPLSDRISSTNIAVFRT
jgi:hypothetical protein